MVNQAGKENKMLICDTATQPKVTLSVYFEICTVQTRTLIMH